MIFAIRIFLAGFILGITFLPLFLLFLCRPTHPNNTWYFSQVFNFIGKYIYQLEYQIEGVEIRDKQGSCIFVSNHQGNMDIFIGSKTLKKGTVSLGKKSLVYIPVFGLLYYLSGNILIDRGNKSKAQAALIRIRKRLRKYNASLWIMPEGTRNNSPQLLPFKRGAFITAIAAQIPIVPVAVAHYKESVNIKKWQKNLFKIKFLEPIPTKGLRSENADALAIKVQSLIQSEIDKMA